MLEEDGSDDDVQCLEDEPSSFHRALDRTLVITQALFFAKTNYAQPYLVLTTTLRNGAEDCDCAA